MLSQMLAVKVLVFSFPLHCPPHFRPLAPNSKINENFMYHSVIDVLSLAMFPLFIWLFELRPFFEMISASIGFAELKVAPL